MATAAGHPDAIRSLFLNVSTSAHVPIPAIVAMGGYVIREKRSSAPKL